MKETIVSGRSCFSNDGGEKNDGVEGNEKVLNSGVSASGKLMKGCW
jgi:hypothetical protein